MHVLHVVDNFGHGGTEMHVLKLTRALRARGHTVSLLLIGRDGPLAEEYARDGVVVHRRPVGSLLSIALWSRVRAVAECIEHVDPQVVHAHDIYSNVVIALARSLCRGQRRWIASQRFGMPKSMAWRVALRFAFRRADFVTANGVGTQAIVHRLIGASEKAVVTPNFLEPECFVEPEDRLARQLATLAAAGVTNRPGTVWLGSVGRLQPVKRVDRMIRAVATLRARGLDVELLIVGDGGERAALEAEARSLGVAEWVHFLGARPRLPLSQVLFDIALLTSSSEGVPNALVEAFACGVPCVATDVGGVARLVGGQHGIVVDATDEAAFADAVEQLARSVELRATLGRQAYDTAVTQWHEQMVLPLIERVYHGT